MIVVYAKEVDVNGRIINLSVIDTDTMTISKLSRSEIKSTIGNGIKMAGVKINRSLGKAEIKIVGSVPDINDETTFTALNRTVATNIEEAKFTLITNKDKCGTVEYSKLLSIYESGRLANMKMNGNSKKLCLSKGTLEVV